MKSSVIQSNVYVNDQVVNTIQDLEPYTLYVNPYFVITEFSNADKVSKHYYMGTQRIASELAVQTTNYSPLVSNSGSTGSASSSTESHKTQTNTGPTLNQGLESALPVESSNPWLNNLNEAFSEFGEDQLTLEETRKDIPTIESIYPDLSPTTSYNTTTARVIYWYHPDYIGNVDLVSDNSGEAYEFFLYSPWGENLYEWNSGTASFSSPYRFNGKELDSETGFTYYGARYYDNQLGMWLSVDPFSDKYPSLTPYNFVANNTLSLVDPDGNKIYVADMNESTRNKMVADLSEITGLTLTVGKDGYLEYSRNEGASGYSAKAQELLILGIDNENEENMVTTFAGGSKARDNLEPGLAWINLDSKQIEGFISASYGVNKKTLGYGMTFLHELAHTESTYDLKDDFSTSNSKGENVDFMNEIRAELGEDWGQRQSYPRIGGYLPFDEYTKCLLERGEPLDVTAKMIMPSTLAPMDFNLE